MTSIINLVELGFTACRAYLSIRCDGCQRMIDQGSPYFVKGNIRYHSGVCKKVENVRKNW